MADTPPVPQAHGDDGLLGGYAPQGAPEQAIDLGEYLRMLLRRATLIGGVAAVVFVAFGVATFLADDFYTAESVLLIERVPHRIIDVEDVLTEATAMASRSNDFYNTQFEILKSRSLAARVIDELALPYPVEVYGKMLGVDPVRDSRLVRVTFTSADPEVSARVANAHARAFIQSGIELRSEATLSAQRFLDETLAELKARVNDSERVLSAFRRERGMVDLEESGGLVVDQLDALHTQLAAARSARITAATQLRMAREGGHQAAPVLSADSSIARLDEELDLLRAEDRYQSRTLPNPALGMRIEELELQLDAEVQRVISELEARHRSAQMMVRQLEAELEKQKDAAIQLKDVSVEYAVLKREVDTNRELYDNVLQRKKELGMAAELLTSNVFVIDRATPPRFPSGPARGKRLAIGLLLGLMLGVGVAFGLELLDDSVKKPQEVEDVLGLSYLGTIPNLESSPKREGGMAFVVPPQLEAEVATGFRPATRVIAAKILANLSGEPARHHGAGEAKEAYVAVRTSLLLSRAGEPPGTLLFSSARLGDGKTLTTLNVAASFAQLGAPVLVIDADLRRPRCHEYLGLERQVGLTEVLAGQCDVGDAIRPVRPPLYFLGAGSQTPPDPIELLGSEQMHTVLKKLLVDYTYVLIDAPPLLPVSDAVALSPLVDGVVLVISNHTPKPAALKACARLRHARARVLGAVLNRFDLRATGEEYISYTEA